MIGFSPNVLSEVEGLAQGERSLTNGTGLESHEISCGICLHNDGLTSHCPEGGKAEKDF